MRSPAELRRLGEWLCRSAALALLAWALYASARRETAQGTADMATQDAASTLSAQLRSWSQQPHLTSVHIELSAAPDALVRDWLRALGRAGTRVTWSGRVPATAIAGEPVPNPRGGTRVDVAAPDGARVIIADAIGQVDSVVAAAGGASVRAPSTIGQVTATTGGTSASTTARGRRMFRRVVMLGRAGWEAKFVAAALEEQGWTVSVRLRVAPGLAVGAPLALDTATVSAVIALDSTAGADAGAIARFVRAGGGLVLGVEAARIAALAGIAPARPAQEVSPKAIFASAAVPVTRLTLPQVRLVGLRRDAVVLDQRGDTVLAAARRVEMGRVVQIGYDETWRWRMAGGDESPDAHRVWWSQLVESVAHAPLDSSGADTRAHGDRPAEEPAPRAALVAALREASERPMPDSGGRSFDPSRSVWVYISAALLLLVEWTSRRIRGAR